MAHLLPSFSMIFCAKVFLIALSIIVPVTLFAKEPLAFTVEPMSAEILLPKKYQNFTLRNLANGPRKLRIEITARREENQLEVNVPSKDLWVSEPEISLGPLESKVVKIEYRGPVKVPVERAFRVIVTDETLSAGANPLLKLSYRASIFVREPGHSADVVVRSFKKLEQDRFEVELENKGRVRQPLAGLEFFELRVHADSNKLLSSTVILAKSRIKIQLQAADVRQLAAVKDGSPPKLRFTKI